MLTDLMTRYGSELGVAIAGGIVTIILVAIWRWSSAWIWRQLKRGYQLLLRVNPLISQLTMGVAVGIIVFVMATQSGNELKILTGSVDINGDTYPDVHDPHCRPNPQVPLRLRGARGERVDFSTPFASAPEVFMALSYIDTMTAGDPLRISTRVTAVDAHGFNYDLVVWCKTTLWRGRASWIAVAN